jgi:hypothetical protein
MFQPRPVPDTKWFILTLKADQLRGHDQGNGPIRFTPLPTADL